MPCNCDYMEANGFEIGMSQVYCLLDELKGEKFDSNHWRGYHPKAYGKSRDKEKHDKATEKLCSFLQNTDVTKYSLEMQIWWRDHQRADKERLEKELEEQKTAKLKQKALSKLSKYELKLLGLEARH